MIEMDNLFALTGVENADVIVIVDRKLTPLEAVTLFFKLEEEKENEKKEFKEKVKLDKRLYKKRLKDKKFSRKLTDMVDMYEDGDISFYEASEILKNHFIIKLEDYGM